MKHSVWTVITILFSLVPFTFCSDLWAQRVKFTAAQRQHWAFRPPGKPKLPTVKNTAWARGPIDTFILHQLETRSLQPSAPAARATLLRRATFGLTGLPPTARQLQIFLTDKSPVAFSKVVDRLLASEAYGEQWARHWLDVVRYSDTLGGTANFPFANAYHYRDYVIRALNKDKPFDRFVQELIAGDLLPAGDTEDEADRLTGPGALLLGPYILNDKVDAAADQIQMLSQALLGLNIGCSRCHDHPFEPLPARDFYALAAIFTSTQTKRFERNVVLPNGQRISVLSAKEGKVSNLRIHPRGDAGKPGAEVPRGLPPILTAGKTVKIPTRQSGRLQLARWLVSKQNPLTARVIVNRIWQRHFGVGLVADPDNFGMSAVSQPSNQRLLDWLAVRLIEQHWSLKWLHRTILHSAVYQQSSANRSERAHKIDPDNRLLWRQNRRRLEGEEIRDSLLFISGQLNPTKGGSLLARLGLGNSAELKKGNRLELVVSHFRKIQQRSIYRPVIRTEMHMAELLDTFDFPGRDETTGRRLTSTNAVQSLLLMNSQFVLKQARGTVQQTLDRELKSDADRVQTLYQSILGRNADAAEVRAAIRYREACEAKLPGLTNERVRRAKSWQLLCQVLFMSNEFIYVD